MTDKVNHWKHKDWKTFPGTWGIFSVDFDKEIITMIKSNPKKYGKFEDWEKIS